ncbi:MAG: hypothetical protein ACPGR2_00715 [Psychrobium sp.]
MKAQQLGYQQARAQMQPGDVIAFGGNGAFSKVIKLATFSQVSHVGIILKTQLPGASDGQFFNQIIESTGKKGVAISRFSQVLEDYDGDVWWLPLSEQLRQHRFNAQAFFDFLYHQSQQAISYDLGQALMSAVDAFEKLFDTNSTIGGNDEDFSKFFCSELVAAALERSQAVDAVNASEVTPIDLCRWNIYQDQYYLLKGDSEKAISRFNSTAPQVWNKEVVETTVVI